MTYGIKRKVILALKAVNQEIVSNSVDHFRAPGMPNYAAGLATEGYAGGYADALRDVLLALDGVDPNRRGYWNGSAK